MGVTSKVGLCNLALSRLGNYNSVEDIDTPVNREELLCSLWYDISMESFLKMTIPNFAMARKTVAKLSETVPYPFTYAYQYPSDALKILGVGAVEDKRNDYTVENSRIYTDVDYSDGMPIRYIKSISDVTKMSPEFKIAFSWYMAANIALDLTQDMNKVQLIEQLLPSKMSEMSGINAQENRPIRISRSKFKEARYSGRPASDEKR